MNETALQTPLYQQHIAAGGKMVPFAGYWLPVQYESGGVIAEHNAVRQAAGLFDVSHMGEVLFQGKDALANLQNLLTNDLGDLQINFVRYSPMCYENGGVVDDLLIYRLGETEYLAVVNAANREKDVIWMQQNQFGDVVITDISDSLAQLALQGPRAATILDKLAEPASLPQKNYTCRQHVAVAGIDCLVSRTGYTGEDGFELYFNPAAAPALWQALLTAGTAEGLIPCGLGARDTLRLEAAMPLYGHEMDENVTPWEAGLGWAVKMDKPAFIGKEAIQAKGRDQVRVGLKITGRGIAREHCPIYVGETLIGHTTSGTHGPYVNYALAMGRVDSAWKAVDTQVEVEVRGRRLAAVIIPLPFYKHGA